MIFHDPLMFENAYSFPIDTEILYKIMKMHLKINSSPTALVNSSFVIVSHILTTLFLVSSHLFTYVKGIFLSREDLIFNRGYNFFMQKMFVWRLNREKLYEERKFSHEFQCSKQTKSRLHCLILHKGNLFIL